MVANNASAWWDSCCHMHITHGARHTLTLYIVRGPYEDGENIPSIWRRFSMRPKEVMELRDWTLPPQPFTQQVFTESLLCAKHGLGTGNTVRKKTSQIRKLVYWLKIWAIRQINEESTHSVRLWIHTFNRLWRKTKQRKEMDNAKAVQGRSFLRRWHSGEVWRKAGIKVREVWGKGHRKYKNPKAETGLQLWETLERSQCEWCRMN